MRNSIKILIMFVTFVVFFFSACKSKPEVKEETPVEKPKVVETKPEPKEDLSTISENDKLLAEIERLQGENGALQQSRDRAIELGADTTYSEEFGVPENMVELAKTDIEAGNLQEAINKLHESIDRYDTLSNMMEISTMKAEIDENNFARYASEDFVEAEKYALNTMEHYKVDSKMAKETSEDAKQLYGNVLNKGYYEYTKNAKVIAKNAKKDCDFIKVARSRTEDYNVAVRMFNVGKAEVENSDFKKAFIAYNDSAKKFKDLYESVSVKRAEAKKAMEEAERKQKESSELALEADKEAPLEEASQGFTDKELELQDKSTPISGKADELISDEEVVNEDLMDNSEPDSVENADSVEESSVKTDSSSQTTEDEVIEEPVESEMVEELDSETEKGGE